MSFASTAWLSTTTESGIEWPRLTRWSFSLRKDMQIKTISRGPSVMRPAPCVDTKIVLKPGASRPWENRAAVHSLPAPWGKLTVYGIRRSSA